MHNRLLLAVAATFAIGLSACAGWFVYDGYDYRYCDRPMIEGHRHFRHGNWDVWEVGGHYYRQHEGRWVQYRERPRELREVR